MAGDSFFIVIEGMDGAGKSSLARQLRDSLAPAHGNRIQLTYEPHNPSAAGKHIREVLAQRIKSSPRALALAFALNRIDHLDTVINPFLCAGGKSVVICDRYVLSSLVYQSTDGLGMEEVYQLNRWARRPDLTLYLSVSTRNCYSRLRNRPSNRELFERNLNERAEKYVAAIALLRGKGEQIVELDGNPPFPEVFANANQALQDQGPAWLHIIQPPLL